MFGKSLLLQIAARLKEPCRIGRAVSAAVAIAAAVPQTSFCDPAPMPGRTGKSTPAGWTDDFAAARKAAEETGKPVFVVLCNSDSCGICQGYDERVFSVPKFVKEANKRFVLAYLDSPRDESLAPANFKEQTSQARRLFGVDAAVPRFHILSSDGKRRFECRRFDDSKNQVRDFLDALERIADALAGIRGAEEAIAGLGGGNPDEAARIMRDALVKIDEETLGNYFVDDAEKLVRDNGAFLKDFPYLEFVHPLRKEFAAMRSEIIATAHARFRQRGVDYSYPRFKSFTKEIFDGGGYKEKFKDMLSRVDATKLRVSGRPQTAKSLLRLEKEIKATRSEFAGK